MRKPTIQNLSKDLIETKKADRKKIVFDIIKEWILELNENKKQFITSFLNGELDKDFNKIKNKIGEFKNISKMSVLDFLGKIIIGYSKDNFFIKLHEEFIIMREDFYKKHKEYKRGA